MPYECGEIPVGSSWFQFNLRFYIIALIFLIFDVEIVFLYPCAAIFRDWVFHDIGLFAFSEIFLFIFILVLGLIYVWKKGDLNWVKTLVKRGG
jgi:NADH-quinone oxidoreductase subunit A